MSVIFAEVPTRYFLGVSEVPESVFNSIPDSLKRFSSEFDLDTVRIRSVELPFTHCVDSVSKPGEFIVKERPQEEIDLILSRLKTTKRNDALRLHVGDPVPSFTLQDFSTGDLVEGFPRKDACTLFSFWATWCGNCLVELQPEYIPSVVSEFSDRPDFTFVPVCIDATPTELREFFAGPGSKWHYLADQTFIDVDRTANEIFANGGNIPLNVVVGPDGLVRFIHLGKITDEADLDRLRQAIREALPAGDTAKAGKPVVLRNDGDALPIGHLATNSIAVVNFGDRPDNRFAEFCRKYTAINSYSAENLDFEDIANHRTVIAALYPGQDPSALTLPDTGNLILVSFGPTDSLPASLARGARAIVAVADTMASSQEMAAMALFGGLDVDGRLLAPTLGFPAGSGVDIPRSRLGYASPSEAGMASWLPDSIDALVDAAIASGAMPGCQVLVARRGKVVVDKAFGDITAGGPAVDGFTLYDLASVSKTIGTLPGVMKAYDLGLFDLDTPAAEYIPGLKRAGKTFTPRQMLYHETGMPPAINAVSLALDADGRLRRDITSPDSSAAFPWEVARGIWVGRAAVDTVMATIYRQPLRPTTDYTYSCLNFCLLLDMEQRLTATPHDSWVADSVFGPLGMNNTFYRPTLHAPLSRIAPTELDSVMRRQLVHGYVHDETAALQGGVSGNAGLFANAGDIAKLCQAWLQGGAYGDARILSPETIDLFLTSKSPTCRRGLGFDKPDPDPDSSPTCAGAPLSVVGHTGFTGTIFWIDPAEELIFIFLTNRVNPSRVNPAFARSGIRSKLFSQVLKALNP